MSLTKPRRTRTAAPGMCYCAAYPVPHNDAWCADWRRVDAELEAFRLNIGATS